MGDLKNKKTGPVSCLIWLLLETDIWVGLDWIGHLMKFHDLGLSSNPKPHSCSKKLMLDYMSRNREELTFKPLHASYTTQSVFGCSGSF